METKKTSIGYSPIDIAKKAAQLLGADELKGLTPTELLPVLAAATGAASASRDFQLQLAVAAKLLGGS